jgi:hypothetical protein
MKKMYRITLNPGISNSVVDSLVLMAARSNWGDYISLNVLEMVFEAQKRLYPATLKDYKATVVGDTLLIDRANTKGEYENALIIEGIEVFDLEKEENE